MVVRPTGLTKIERPASVSTEIVRQLLDYLLSGEIPVGGRVPSERDLSAALGIGRSAVRDALKPLQLLGLLEVRVGDGTYLAEPDSALLPRVIEWGILLKAPRTTALIETLRYVEPALARLAAERRTPEALEGLRRNLSRMESPRSKRAFVDGYRAFHFGIASASENSVLCGIFTTVHALIDVGIKRVADATPDTSTLYAEHVPIFEAISAGDPDAAERALIKHMDNGRKLLEATLG